MKNKFKKLGLCLLAPILAIPVVAIASLGVNSLNNNNSNNNDLSGNLVGQDGEIKYLFNGKYYDSLDNIVDELLYNNQYISSDLYYGDALNAIFDHESNRLNINELRKFDNSRISAAYLNAFGAHEQDFNKAKKSFVNEGLVKYKYQDTKGKLHSSYSEAERANLKNVKVDEAVFYKIVDITKTDTRGNPKEYKINPLNPDDINLMKKITINSTKKSFKDSNTASQFSMMPMIKDDEGNFNTLSNPNSLLAKMFSLTPEAVYNEFYTTLNKAYGEAITETMKSAVFTSDVKFNYTNIDGANPEGSYDIEVIEEDLKKMGITVTYDINNKKRIDSLKFEDVSYSVLNDFNVFLNRDAWNKELVGSNSIVKSSVQTIGWFGAKRADMLTFENFLGKKGSFKLYSTGKDGISGGNDSYPNTNAQIMQPGSYQETQLDFTVRFSLKDQKKFLGDFKMNLENEFKKIVDIITPSNGERELELINQLNLGLLESFVTTFTDIEKDIIGKILFNTEYKFRPKGDTSSNNDIEGLNEVIKSLKNEINGGDFLGTVKGESLKVILNIYNDGYIENFFSYNNVPVFKTQKENMIMDNFVWDKKFYNSYLSAFFSEENVNSSSLNKLKNISNWVSEDGKKVYNYDDDKIDKKLLKVYTEMDRNGYFIIPDSIKEYQGKLKDINGGSDSPSVYNNNLYYALNSYNKNLKWLRSEYGNSLPQNIVDKMIKKEDENDILVLRGGSAISGGDAQILEIYYGEYVSLAYDFNESLNNRRLIYDKVSLDASINANNIIEPAKVIVIYDLSGNIINPGIELTEDLVMETTSDAMYDSERTILDNIYRTLIIKKDPNKVFYKNDNNTYTLLEYQTNFIYQLEYDKKTHYFLTHKDAWLYLREIIALEAQKINIRGIENETI
ncbi:MAG: hypothetical protein ACRC1F_00780 [Metamycoplasmataceae bacterium]